MNESHIRVPVCTSVCAQLSPLPRAMDSVPGISRVEAAGQSSVHNFKSALKRAQRARQQQGASRGATRLGGSLQPQRQCCTPCCTPCRPARESSAQHTPGAPRTPACMPCYRALIICPAPPGEAGSGSKRSFSKVKLGSPPPSARVSNGLLPPRRPAIVTPRRPSGQFKPHL